MMLAPCVQGAVKASLDMSLDASGNITESVSGKKLHVGSIRQPMNLPGAVGQALLFDGYTTYVNAAMSEITDGEEAYTLSLWLAPEAYPMMALDRRTDDKALIAGTLDTAAKTGFGFFLGREGDFSYKYFSNGWPGELKAERKLPIGKWTLVTVTVDPSQRKVHLYFNADEVGTANCMTSNPLPAANLMLGHDSSYGITEGGYRLDTFTGLMDDFKVVDGIQVPDRAVCVAQNDANYTIPAAAWDDQPLRPLFHAMPARNWMNECHGLAYSEGRWHLFFQKNPNGPYMSRLHWGHVSSEDLCTWREEPVAIDPGADYDIKGCWSGCLFSDPVLTGGLPRAFYTGVDYGRARVIEAVPTDASLLTWNKKGVAVDGVPGGMSDDFRDCFVFRNDDNYYMIVGTSKDNKGACTLHRYDKATSSWTSGGNVFYQASNANLLGRFWEMPSVTKIGDHWLFCVTPLDMMGGVKAIYWVGDINSDGTFSPITPANQPGTIELSGTSKEGFGLLSPTVYNTDDGRTLAMGIVPDKLGGADNNQLGWAHNISLPREWSLSADNKLLQKPAAELLNMRSQCVKYSDAGFTLSGFRQLGEVAGHRCEVRLSMKKGNSKAGIRLMEENGVGVKVEYNPMMNTIAVDMREVSRRDNDGWCFGGLYEGSIPESIPAGGDIVLDVFADGSILDVFVNDRYAFSTRVFPNSMRNPKASVYSDGNTEITMVEAWQLEAAGGSGINVLGAPSDDVKISASRMGDTLRILGLESGEEVQVYSIDGLMLASGTAYGPELMLTLPEIAGIILLRTPKGVIKL